MATGAIISTGSTLKIKTTGTTYVKIAEMKDFSGLFAGAAAILDATHLESTAKEKLIGLPDEGSIKFTFNVVPDDVGQAALFTARSDATAKDFQLTVPKMKKMYSYSAFVLSVEPVAGVDKVMELNVTMEITGPVASATAPTV
jgi:hypothetical protein